MSDPRPIGVFDSGVGGLSVVRALVEALPEESIVYLGDTARLPYGTKSAATVRRYALAAAAALVRHDVKMLVIACNTATAAALAELARVYAPLPVVGVVDPGARAAVWAGASRVLVLATESTVRGGAYQEAIGRLAPRATVVGQACPLLVALAEEGWTDGDVPRLVVRRYLRAHLEALRPEAIVLGCTHFPLLADVIAREAGPGVRLVDSARTTAAEVAETLDAAGRRAPPIGRRGTLRLLATDDPRRFATVGARFLGAPIDAATVLVVDLHPDPAG